MPPSDIVFLGNSHGYGVEITTGKGSCFELQFPERVRPFDVKACVVNGTAIMKPLTGNQDTIEDCLPALRIRENEVHDTELYPR